VNEFVLFEGEASSEGLVTDVALECFHFCVCFLMRFQVADLAEGTSANVALVWFLSSMDANVLLQVLGKTEAFVAVVATEGSLIGVDHLMTVKILEKSESTTACLTLMGACFVSVRVVCEFVGLERVLVLEETTAAIALVLMVGHVSGLVLLERGQV